MAESLELLFVCMDTVYLNKTHFVSFKSLREVLTLASGQATEPSSFAINLDNSSEIHFRLQEGSHTMVPGQEFKYKIFASNQSHLVVTITGKIGFKGMILIGKLLQKHLPEKPSSPCYIILDFQEVSWISRRGRIVFDQLISKPDIQIRPIKLSFIFNPYIYFIYKEKLPLFSLQKVAIFKSIFQAFMQMNTSKYPKAPAIETSLPAKLKKLKPMESYSKEELYEQLAQIQQTAFDAQMELRADNERLLKFFLDDHYSKDDLEKEKPPLVGDIHNKLFQAAYKLKMDTLHLESRFDSLEEEIEKRQEKLIAHESNLSAIIENTQDIIFSLNSDLEVLLTNSKGYNFSKEYFDFEMNPGTYLPIHLPQEISEELEPKFKEALNGKTSQLFLPIRKGQDEIFFQFSINPIINKDGLVEGLSCVARDVTDQEARKKKVSQQQDLIYSISKNIQEGIFRTTREDGIQYINQAFVEMFGYENEDELKQINLDNLYANPKQRQEIITYMEQNTYFINKEVIFKRKDGSTFWGLMSSTKLENAHGEVFFDGAIRDVSHIKETREILQKKNEELDKFVWSTSHDLRAPLVSVLGLIDVARMDSKNEQVNHYMGLMEVSIKKLINFIHDIIDYAQNNNVQIEVERLNLKEIIQETFNTFQYLENAPSIQLRVIERGDQPFYSDKKRLIIILKNLLSNAINYADLNKQEPFIRVEVHNSSQEISFCVKDNGIGIKNDCQDKVFDMFYRGTKRSKGSGIGLYIVKETVGKLNGRIEMESTEGLGSRFCVHLPNVNPT